MANPNDETKHDYPDSFSEHFFAKDESGYNVQIAAATHPGKVRRRNEDHYAVIRRTRRCEILLSNLQTDGFDLADGHAYGMLVADGVGGAQHGDFASHLVLETTLQSAGQATSWLMKFTNFNTQEVEQRVAAYISRIREEFHRHADLDPDKRQMGTTLTAVYLLPPHAIISHIGDSRAYVYRDHKLRQITRDQTLAQALVDAGSAPADVKHFGHVLANSVDPVREEITAEVMHLELRAGDRFLLCSDGLTDMVAPDKIANILSKHELEKCCDALVEAALEGGGKDNITVVVCDLSLTDDQPTQPIRTHAKRQA